MDERAAVLRGYSQRLASEEKGMGTEAAQICTMDPFDPELLARVPQPVKIRPQGRCGSRSWLWRREVVNDSGLCLRRGVPVSVTEDQSRMLHLDCFSKELLFLEESEHLTSPSDTAKG